MVDQKINSDSMGNLSHLKQTVEAKDEIYPPHEHQDYIEIDYESFPVLKQHKISSLRAMVQEVVNRKYKISLF